MKIRKATLCLMLIMIPSGLLAQSKGEMPFTTSKNVNKLVRNAWVAYSDANMDEGNKYALQALKEDPQCGMAYASLLSETPERRKENLAKAESMKLSADEKMFIEGLRAGDEKKSTSEYFDPLIKKYPADNYLHLLIMFTNTDKDRAIEIGENLIRRNPKFSPAYNLLGYYYMNKNELSQAESNFNKYVSLRPELANPYDSKGDYMLHTGKNEEAVALFEKAAALGMSASKSKAEQAKLLMKYPKPGETDINEIKTLLSTSFAAYEKANPAEILSAYADQSIEIFDNQIANIGMPNLQQRTVSMFEAGTFKKNKFDLASIQGNGTIAMAYGKTESVFEIMNSGKTFDRRDHAIFLMKKQADGNWKVLADHFYDGVQSPESISSNDTEAIRSLLNRWEQIIGPGQTISEKHLDNLSKLYSLQAIEILPSQQSVVGIGNIRARWDQYQGIRYEKNNLNPMAIEGLGKRAIACGVGHQIIHLKETNEPITNEFPWAMILTKEKDDTWRILALHFL